MTEEEMEIEGWKEFELALAGMVAGVIVLALAMAGSLLFWWW